MRHKEYSEEPGRKSLPFCTLHSSKTTFTQYLKKFSLCHFICGKGYKGNWQRAYADLRINTGGGNQVILREMRGPP